jgi:hypothetical protein
MPLVAFSHSWPCSRISSAYVPRVQHKGFTLRDELSYSRPAGRSREFASLLNESF